MRYLKQSTAITLRFGPFLDETDGKTAETGLTISQADIRLSKAGGDFAQTNDADGATHDEAGWYSLELDATDTNTLGMLTVAIHESGALPVWEHFTVLPANSFDSFVSGSDYLQTDVIQIEGADATNQIPTTAQINTEVDTALSDIGLDHLLAAAVIGADVTDNSVVAKLASKSATADWDSYNNTTDSHEAIRDNMGTAQTGDSFARLGAPAGASVSADIAAIVADTNELQTDWVNGGRLDLLIDAILADTTSLNDTVLAEITGAGDIPATPTIRQAVMLLYMWLRNKGQVSTSERRVFNDADSEVLDSPVSDTGTLFTQEKLGAA